MSSSALPYCMQTWRKNSIFAQIIITNKLQKRRNLLQIRETEFGSQKQKLWIEQHLVYLMPTVQIDKSMELIETSWENNGPLEQHPK